MGASKDKPDTSEFKMLPHLAVLAYPVMVGLAVGLKGWWSAIGTIFFLGVLPLCDLFSGKDVVNPSKEQAKELDGQFKYRLIMWMWVPIHLCMWFGSIHFSKDETTPLWQKINIAVGTGILGGVSGVSVAHELSHMHNKFEKFLSRIIFFSLGWDHVRIAHVHGHHFTVATPEDPSTAFYGQTYYDFLPRALVGIVKVAWEIEHRSLARKQKNVFSLSNKVISGAIIELLILSACIYVYGMHGALMFLGQSFVGLAVIECTNYTEHYGLLREQYADGSYEPVDLLHAWNGTATLSNMIVFKVQRHSDHHVYPYKRYQSLINYTPEEVGHLPAGFPAMILLAFFPPLWFRVMNPRVQELRKALQEKKKQKNAQGVVGRGGVKSVKTH